MAALPGRRISRPLQLRDAPLHLTRPARHLRWPLDVVVKDDLSRYREGNGAKNMAVVRRFALNLIRVDKAKGSIKTKREAAGWDPNFLLEILQQK
jgi:hypothetical protein